MGLFIFYPAYPAEVFLTGVRNISRVAGRGYETILYINLGGTKHFKKYLKIGVRNIQKDPVFHQGVWNIFIIMEYILFLFKNLKYSSWPKFWRDDNEIARLWRILKFDFEGGTFFSSEEETSWPWWGLNQFQSYARETLCRSVTQQLPGWHNRLLRHTLT